MIVRRGARWWAAAAVLGAVTAAGVMLTVPGCLSIDEVTYLLSARSLGAGYGIEVWNGFEELPSPELAPAWLKVVGGRLVSQYPDFFLFLARPAYRAWGFAGLFYVNLMAFLGVVALTWSLARRRYGARAAVLAVVLLVGGTFAWEYAVAAWPHMVSALLVLVALASLERTLDRPGPGRLTLPLLAGMACGVGIGVRLDVAFVLAGFAAALLLQRPARARETLALLAGTLPPLAALALVNRAKFGLTTPFTYGPSYGIATGIGPHLPLAAAAGVALAVLIVITRPRLAEHASRRRLALAMGGIAVVVIAVPVAREAAGQLARGLWELLVDMRIRPLERVDPASARAPDGAVVYFGSLKKALLQSCPWLPLVAVPLIEAVRRRSGRGRLLLDLAAPVMLIGPYGFSAWDGGLSLNQRYFVPALPMLAIFAARGLEWLRERAGGRLVGIWATFFATVAAALLLARGSGFDAARQSDWLLDLPLAVVLGLALLLAAALGTGSAQPWPARAASWLAGVAVGLALWSCFGYDLPRTLARRAFHAACGAQARALVGDDALIFSEPAELFASAVTPGSRIRLANPARDGYRTFRALARFHRQAERVVLLGAFRARADALRRAGLLGERELLPRAAAGPVVLMEITALGEPAAVERGRERSP